MRMLRSVVDARSCVLGVAARAEGGGGGCKCSLGRRTAECVCTTLWECWSSPANVCVATRQMTTNFSTCNQI